MPDVILEVNRIASGDYLLGVAPSVCAGMVFLRHLLYLLHLRDQSGFRKLAVRGQVASL